jgi:sec-independent protein translocase protein TatC
VARTIERARPGRARPDPDAMTLFEHLSELRRRLIVCIVVFLVAGIATYFAYGPILAGLRQPYCQALVQLHQIRHLSGCRLYITQPLQGFTTRLNVSAYGGIVLGIPVILYELWRFVTPGLKANERRYALPFVVMSVVLFAAGGLVAFFIYGRALNFLIGASGAHVQTIFTPNSYLSLLGALVLIFGAAFEFPVLLVGLELAGALTSAGLRSFRRWAILLIVIFSAVITPSSDPFSMLALAIPLLVFYEGAIVIGRLLGK